MARNRTNVDASVDTVFAVLANPRAYAYFVVGTKRVREFDPAWPKVGSAFHVTLGFGPLMLRDATRVVELEQPQRLVLEAGLGPIGQNLTAFRLESHGRRTEVELEEHPIRGPAAKVWNPALDRVLWLRNAELLRRLKKRAERLQRQRVGPAAEAR